jgi:hypothetical protein
MLFRVMAIVSLSAAFAVVPAGATAEARHASSVANSS